MKYSHFTKEESESKERLSTSSKVREAQRADFWAQAYLCLPFWPTVLPPSLTILSLVLQSCVPVWLLLVGPKLTTRPSLPTTPVVPSTAPDTQWDLDPSTPLPVSSWQLWRHTDLTQIPVLPFTSCVAWGGHQTSLSLSCSSINWGCLQKLPYCYKDEMR